MEYPRGLCPMQEILHLIPILLAVTLQAKPPNPFRLTNPLVQTFSSDQPQLRNQDQWQTGVVKATKPYGAFVTVSLPDGGTGDGLVPIEDAELLHEVSGA